MRKLTYYIPIQRMSRTPQIQAAIAKEAMAINGSCLVSFETLHTTAEIFSTMVMTMFVKTDHSDYVHRSMQQVISVTLALYSPDTDLVRVTDESVAVRDFNAKEIL